MKLKRIRKALVPVGVSGILSVLAVFGIYEGMTVGELVSLAVTSFFVWLVRNDEA